MARKKRSLHGTYSPQNEEFKAPIIEMTDILKVPDERFKERLIWGELLKIKTFLCILNGSETNKIKNDTKFWTYIVLILRSQRQVWIDLFLYQWKSQNINRENAPQKYLNVICD